MLSLFQSTPPVKAATAEIDAKVENAQFQSTPPVKAATFCCLSLKLSKSISIHAAREGGDVNVTVCKVFAKISIHAAREGGDRRCVCANQRYAISIHAAREGGDTIAVSSS